MTEEDAFWCLVNIAANYDMSLMWRDGFPALARGKFVLERLLKQHMPRVAAHLEDESVMMGLIACVAC